MHYHTVFFWLKSDLNEIDIHEFREGLNSLCDIDGVDAGRWGIPVKSDREVVDDGFQFSLYLNFVDSEAEKRYQIHPVHLKFVEEHKDKWTSVKVFDSLAN